jgi:multiple sugar transport system permease protein
MTARSATAAPAAVPRRRPAARPTAWLERERVLGWVLVLPALAILAAFIVYPFCVGLWLSVSDATVVDPGQFVGLRNFVQEAGDGIFRQAVRNTLVYTAVTVVLKGLLGLGLAVLMNQAIRGKNLIRAALLLPWIVPTALSTIAWRWLFDSTYSIVNWVTVTTGFAQAVAPTAVGHLLGIHPNGINWLGDATWAMVTIILANIWRGTPFFAISLLAGLQTIGQDMYEAAAIDGATAAQRFRYVTVPLVRPVLLVVLLFSFIWTISDFQLVYVLTGGGPANSTHLFSTLAYQIAMQAGQLGQGAAVSLAMFPFLLAIVAGLLWYLRRHEL